MLVTGATGTVGSKVVRRLVDAGVALRAAVHARPLDTDAVEACTIDYDRPETLAPALEGVRVVFLASYATLHEQTLVDAARSAGVERIVKLSAWRAAEQGFEIGRWHREVEQAIEASGIAWTFLRPNFFMQNFVNYVGEGIREEGAIYEPAGNAAVSYIDARDIAAVAARVLTTGGHEGRAYQLSGPRHSPTTRSPRHSLACSAGRSVTCARTTRASGTSCSHTGSPKRTPPRSPTPTATAAPARSPRSPPPWPDLTGREPIPFAQFCREHAPTLAASTPATR